MSELAEISVKYVNLPKEGKKWGNVKTDDDVLYWAMAPLLRQFSQGEACKIEFDGKDPEFKKLTKKIGTGAVGPTKITRARSNPSDSEQIFVTALLKEFIAAGTVQMSTTDIVAAVKDLRLAYHQTFGGTEAQKRDDLNDEIPY